MSYSVLYDPIVEAEYLDGHREEVGFYQIITKAHQIRDVYAVSPLAKYALVRLFIAFLMDMVRLDNVYDRKALLKAGSFDAGMLDNYICECEKDGPRFDLFDKVHPFMQSVYDAQFDTSPPKPAAILFFELPSGNNHVHFDHRLETQHSISVLEAFQGLCSTYAFCTAGVQGYPSSVNNTPPLFMVVEGETLFHTLVLNMLSALEYGNIPLGCVTWREDKPVIPKEVYVNVGMLEALAWLPRRATLVLDENGQVSSVRFQQGRNFLGNDLWHDPHVPSRRNKERFFTIKPQLGREVWRDLGALTMAQEGVYSPPLTVMQARSVWAKAPALLRVWYVGLITNKAAILGWTEGRLAVPTLLLENDELAYQFQHDMVMIEHQQNDIHYIISKHLGGEVAAQAQSLYLQQMREYILNHHMVAITTMKISESGNMLMEAMRTNLNLVLHQIVEQTGSDVKALLCQREVKSYLFIRFNKQRKEREKLEA